MKRTEKTLLEQLQISDADITRRMDLLSLEQQNLNLLNKYRPIIEVNIDQIVEEFYERQTAVDEISVLIGDADTLARLRTAQRKYVLDLFSGIYDVEYVNNRLRIGLVHKRIGVEPKLYLSAVQTLKEIIVRTLGKALSDSAEYAEVVQTLDRLLCFDVTLVFDTYIESMIGEIEIAKDRTEMYARSLELKVAERTRQLEMLTKKDPLTNLYNRRAMQELFHRELTLARRHKSKISMAYFDVDDFKGINDKYGHIRGDEVLSDLAQAIMDNVRETDIPCRYGGDEFCLILPECGAASAKITCEKILGGFADKHSTFSLSIGIGETGPDHYLDENELIELADKQMYQAKKEKGASICL